MRDLLKCCVAMVVAGLTACGPGPTALKDLTIAWIPKESGNQVFETGHQGALLKATELSQNAGRKVSIKYLAPARADDIAGQKAMVQQAIDEKVDAIAISCSGRGTSVEVDKAVAAGIPVMSWDSDCLREDGTQSNRFTYFGIDNFKTGELTVRLLTASLTQANVAPPWRVGILTGVPVSANLQSRTAGVWKQLKTETVCGFNGHSGNPVGCWPTGTTAATAKYHVYFDEHSVCTAAATKNPLDADACASAFCNEESAACAPKLETLVDTDRDSTTAGAQKIQGLLMVGLWPLFGYSATPASNNVPKWTAAGMAGLKTISYDSLPFQLTMMQASPPLLSAAVGQKYWGWGYDVTEIVYEKLVNNKTYDPDFLDSDADVVCPNNVDVMQSAWTSSNFTTALPKCSLLP